METPILPDWAQARVRDKRGLELKFLTMKTLDVTDLSTSYNRIQIPDEAMLILRSYLTNNEKQITDRMFLADFDYSDLNIRRNNKGLDVFINYQASEERLQLTMWDGNNLAINIKGPEWWPPPNFYNLQPGHKLAIWMFRRPGEDSSFVDNYRGRLCFIIYRHS